jgi:hypothetical protein
MIAPEIRNHYLSSHVPCHISSFGQEQFSTHAESRGVNSTSCDRVAHSLNQPVLMRQC